MFTSSHADDGTAAELLLTLESPEDSGAQTADRYDWQAAMAAAHGLRLLLDALDASGGLRDDESRRIVCEHHEDWAVVHEGDAELVSCKHRDPSFGAYTTINSLLTDGGLAHLFSRWCALKEKPTCRLVTTAGLASSKPPQKLELVTVALRKQRLAGEPLTVEGKYQSVVDDFAEALLGHADALPEDWGKSAKARPPTLTTEQQEQVVRFLSMLLLDHGRPQRSVLHYAAPSMYVKPVLHRMDVPDDAAEAIWEAVHGLFRTRMRAAGPLPEGGLPIVLAYRIGSPLPDAAEMDRQLAARIVTVEDIRFAIEVAAATPSGYQPLPRMILLNRLGVKMAVGNCSDNSIERAEQLRQDYEEFWRIRLEVDPAARSEQSQLRRVLLRISDNATQTSAKVDRAWGASLWLELQTQVDSMEPGHWTELLDPDLRLGGICDLTNRCKVWFSNRFDIDAELARLAERGTAA
ncbi:hypothetical protein [Micromonospora sp. NPDC005220]|uniref:hypothetical protein n=1 Tax=Micromonospora sp. NPDC005220 TaxID=3155589 RepID=UPI0033A4F5E5